MIQLADVLETHEQKRKETIITGDIVSHPILTFREVMEDNTVKVGFVYELKTTQMVGYEFKEVKINVVSVYDITKWDILKKGDRVELSVLSVQKSSYTEDGKALKCNVIYRRGK